MAEKKGGGILGILAWIWWLIYFTVVSGGMVLAVRDFGFAETLFNADPASLTFPKVCILAGAGGILGAVMWPKRRIIARVVLSVFLIGFIMGIFGVLVHYIVFYLHWIGDPAELEAQKGFTPQKLWMYIGIGIAIGIGLQVAMLLFTKPWKKAAAKKAAQEATMERRREAKAKRLAKDKEKETELASTDEDDAPQDSDE